MIGGVPGQYNFEGLADLAREIPNVDFKGFLPLSEVDKHFLVAKLLVNTSEHEGFPNTFLQAWSKGVPVVSFVDPDNLITRHNLGFVVDSLESMVEKVEEVLNGKTVFSPNAIINTFNRYFSIESAADKYHECFVRLGV
jgi:glycosyltransferase involved in cell wall biosynthesis